MSNTELNSNRTPEINVHVDHVFNRIILYNQKTGAKNIFTYDNPITLDDIMNIESLISNPLNIIINGKASNNKK